MRCLSPRFAKDAHGQRMMAYMSPEGLTYHWYQLTPEQLKTYQLVPISYPCGTCAACLRNRAAEWSFRLEVSLKHSRGACYFITLTYDEDNLPINQYGIPGFNKDHCKKFLKDLRNSVRGHSIRYYFVCEYGGKSHRPHYHFILLDWPFSETALGQINKDKLIGKVLTRIWPYGQVDIGEATSASISYVAEYIITKPSIPKGWDAPFNLMSKGLGSEWLQRKNVQHYYSNLPSSVRQLNKVVKTPRYYCKKLQLSQTAQHYKEQVLRNAERLQDDILHSYTSQQWQEQAQQEADFVRRTFKKFNKSKL